MTDNARIVFQIKIDSKGDFMSYAKDSMSYLETLAFQSFLNNYVKMLEQDNVDDMKSNTEEFD